MSEEKDKDTDGQESSGNDKKPDANAETGPSPKTFTQAELDTIIADRLSRAKPSDYDELKTKAAEHDKAQEAGRSDLEKAQAAQAKAEGERDTANSRVDKMLINTALTTEAEKAGAINVNAVIAMAAESVSFKDGEVAGAAAAVKALKTSEPTLFGEPKKQGAEFGGQTPSSVSEQIKEAEAKGDFNASRLLKIGRMVGK